MYSWVHVPGALKKSASRICLVFLHLGAFQIHICIYMHALVHSTHFTILVPTILFLNQEQESIKIRTFILTWFLRTNVLNSSTMCSGFPLCAVELTKLYTNTTKKIYLRTLGKS